MISKSILLGTFLLFVISPLVFSQSADAVVGEWYTADQRAKVAIYPCGDTYCGKLAWLKEPDNPDGTPKLDDENPNEDLRDRSIEGLEILTDFEYEGDGEYEDGEIYDPESGKTYSCLMRLSDDGSELDVRGYLGISLLGRTEKWTRVSSGE